LSLLLQALFGQNQHDSVVRELETSPALRAAAKKDNQAVFVIARSYALLGRFDEATEWLQLLHNEDRGQYYLGCAHANANRLDQARACFDSLVDREGPYRTQAIMQRGHVFFAQRRIGDAEKDYRTVQEIRGDGPDICYALGLIAFTLDQLDSALHLLTQSLEDQPENGRALFALGAIHERRGGITDALGFYAAAARDSDIRAAANLRAGVLQCRMGWCDDAIQSLQENGAAQTRADSMLFYRGLAFAQSGRFADAIRDWTELSGRYQNDEHLLLNLSLAYYRRGGQAFESGRMQDAVVSWTEYLKLCQNDKRVKQDLAELYFRMATTELANSNKDRVLRVQKLLEHAISLEPVNGTYRYYSALCNLGIGQHQASLQQLMKLMTIQGRQSRLIYHSALCLFFAGDSDGARELLMELKGHEPRDGYTAYGAWALANENLRLGRTAEALESLSGALPEPHAVVA
jgi:superkiller protein 3